MKGIKDRLRNWKRAVIPAMLVGFLGFNFTFGISTIQNRLLDTPLRKAGNGSGVYVCNQGLLFYNEGLGKHQCVSCPNGVEGYEARGNNVVCWTTQLVPSCRFGQYNNQTGLCETQPNTAQCPGNGVWDNSIKLCREDANINTIKQGFSFEDGFGVFDYGQFFETFSNPTIIPFEYGVGVIDDSQFPEPFYSFTIVPFNNGQNAYFRVINTDEIDIPIIGGNGSAFIGYPRWSNGDFKVWINLSNGSFNVYTEEIDNHPESSSWLNYMGSGCTQGNSDFWICLDGRGHILFADRKGYSTGWRPFYCPLNSDWSSTRNACIQASCPDSGYTYNSSLGFCVSNPVCPSGYSYNQATGLCETHSKGYNPAQNCPTGYTKNGSICQGNPIYVCPTGYTWSGITNRCEAGGSVNDAVSY